jgi:hypothetical protein
LPGQAKEVSSGLRSAFDEPEEAEELELFLVARGARFGVGVVVATFLVVELTGEEMAEPGRD